MNVIARNVLSLADGIGRCDLVPEVGGAIAGFWWQQEGRRVDWLRPASGGALLRGDAAQMACFPLIPWGNRIRDGRFTFCGREIRPECGEPHALHGHGWRRPWEIVERTRTRAVLEYEHEPDGWPWAYRARQTVALENGALALTLELQNRSDSLMPAGLGFHPYFPWSPSLTLRASTKGVWLGDEERLPRAHQAPPPAWDFAAGRPVREAIDNVFTGWDGRASLDWAERGCRLAVEAEWPLLSFLALYLADARDYLCVEPMSHAPDAINLARQGAAGTGVRVLVPGASRSARLRLVPACD